MDIDTPERPNPDALLARVKAEESREAHARFENLLRVRARRGEDLSNVAGCARPRRRRGGRGGRRGGGQAAVRHGWPPPRPGGDPSPRSSSPRASVGGIRPGRGLRPREAPAGPGRRARPHQRARLRHAKRSQRRKLLDAGIDVYTTLNVQHWESLNDVVAQITGVVVRETVPDTFLRRAHELALVDIAPEDLLQRLRDGKVYPASRPAGPRRISSSPATSSPCGSWPCATRPSAWTTDGRLPRRATPSNEVWPWEPAARGVSSARCRRA